jgi:hypothetical protein
MSSAATAALNRAARTSWWRCTVRGAWLVVQDATSAWQSAGVTRVSGRSPRAGSTWLRRSPSSRAREEGRRGWASQRAAHSATVSRPVAGSTQRPSRWATTSASRQATAALRFAKARSATRPPTRTTAR